MTKYKALNLRFLFKNDFLENFYFPKFIKTKILELIFAKIKKEKWNS